MSHSQIHLGSKITPHGISSKGFVVQTVVHYGVTKFQFLEYVKKTRLFPILFALKFRIPVHVPFHGPFHPHVNIGTLRLFYEDVIIWWWSVMKGFRVISFMKCLNFIKTVSIDPKFGSKFGSQTSLRLSEFGLLCFFAEWKSLVWK